MPMHPVDGAGSMQAFDPDSMDRHFEGSRDVLPLWMAEPYVPLAPEIVQAVTDRAAAGWYGYETRPDTLLAAFWDWMNRRHGWTQGSLISSVSPSVGTSIGALIDLFTAPGDGVIIQPPVFTDFKPLVRRSGREPIRNPLVLDDGRYSIDFDDLAASAADPATTALILCNPHNPVGRAWSHDELARVAQICGEHGVFVIADEIHADLVLPGQGFTPFATTIQHTSVRWAAIHGPIKTFGLAGVADTLLITDDEDVSRSFRQLSSRLHLTRNNVFGIAASSAAYTDCDQWVDDLRAQTQNNLTTLDNDLPTGIRLITPEATYLAWLDFRDLGMDVPQLASWLATEAGLALSPGHWFGREGAGFARMSIAVEPSVITEAVARLHAAVSRLSGS